MKKFLLILLYALSVKAVPTLVSASKEDTTSNATVSSIVHSYGAAVTSGNLLVCHAVWYSAGSDITPTCADDINGNWTLATKKYSASDDAGIGLWYFYNTGAGTPSVTVTFSHTVNYYVVQMEEFSGVKSSADPIDKSAVGNKVFNAGTDSIYTPSVTPTEDGELFIGIQYESAGITGGQYAVGTDFSILASTKDDGFATYLQSEYFVQSTAAAHVFSYTNGAVAARMIIIGATFKAAPACTPATITAHAPATYIVGDVGRFGHVTANAYDSINIIGTWPDSSVMLAKTTKDTVAYHFKKKTAKAGYQIRAYSCAGANTADAYDTITIGGWSGTYTSPIVDTVGVAATHSPTNTTSADSFSYANLPSGATGNKTTGVISWTPTTSVSKTGTKIIGWYKQTKSDSTYDTISATYGVIYLDSVGTPDSGHAGATIKAYGRGFGETQGLSTISFGDSTPTATSWSNTEIDFPCPNLPAGWYDFICTDGVTADTILNAYKVLITQFTLTMAGTNATSTTPSIGAHLYDTNTAVSISQTNNPGYRFWKWTRTISSPVSPFGDSTLSSTTIAVRGNVTATAVDSIIHYTLTMAGTGTNTPTNGAYTVDTNAATSISNTPGTDSAFKQWTVSGGAVLGSAATVNNNTVRLSANGTVTAVDTFIPPYRYVSGSLKSCAPFAARDTVIVIGAVTIDTSISVGAFRDTGYDIGSTGRNKLTLNANSGVAFGIYGFNTDILTGDTLLFTGTKPIFETDTNLIDLQTDSTAIIITGDTLVEKDGWGGVWDVYLSASKVFIGMNTNGYGMGIRTLYLGNNSIFQNDYPKMVIPTTANPWTIGTGVIIRGSGAFNFAIAGTVNFPAIAYTGTAPYWDMYPYVGDMTVNFNGDWDMGSSYICFVNHSADSSVINWNNHNYTGSQIILSGYGHNATYNLGGGTFIIDSLPALNPVDSNSVNVNFDSSIINIKENCTLEPRWTLTAGAKSKINFIGANPSTYTPHGQTVAQIFVKKNHGVSWTDSMVRCASFEVDSGKVYINDSMTVSGNVTLNNVGAGDSVIVSKPVYIGGTYSHAAGVKFKFSGSGTFLTGFVYAGSPQSDTVGKAITMLTPTISGTPDSFSVSPAPPSGLTMSHSTGEWTGTPLAQQGATVYTITAYGSEHMDSAQATITITIYCNGGPYSYASSPAKDTLGKAAKSQAITNPGCLFDSAIARSLPAGLVCNKTTGAITGTPSAVAAKAGYWVVFYNMSGGAVYKDSCCDTITVFGCLRSLSYSTSPETFIIGTKDTSYPTIDTWGCSADSVVNITTFPASMTRTANGTIIYNGVGPAVGKAGYIMRAYAGMKTDSVTGVDTIRIISKVTKTRMRKQIGFSFGF